ncbi:MAG TPA: hypothetical protein VMT69_10565, partial [Kineosporiaceae bacterium]|nr:hypothetical protein [Kineosporiaceae bacterium]
LGWPLLFLCSKGNQAWWVRHAVERLWPGVAVTAADLLHRDLLRAPDTWLTDDHPAARQRLDVDTNRKRNLGLAAARMTGRTTVLFVDDDLCRLRTPSVVSALQHLLAGESTVAAWPCDDFPDNSVVHHARRDFLGLDQDVFIGAGAMLVAVDGWQLPGFPPIYNEDWLFLWEPIASQRVVAGPDVGQERYDPYASPERARDEEFGDVLGEGLYHLLHEGLPVAVALGAGYWRSVHAKRTRLIQRIIAELRRRLSVVATESEHTRLVHALAALEESRKRLTRATPESLADFVGRWRHDEELWTEYLEKLPRRDTLKEALLYLGLQESWIVTSGRC